jgi:hypothetical protein
MIRYYIIIILIILSSCNYKQEKENDIKKKQNKGSLNAKNSIINKQKDEAISTEILETFVDSLNIGKKGKCKIEIIKHRVYEDNFIIIKFYIKGFRTMNEKESWLISDTYSYETNAMFELYPNISDFNNDKFNDITFISANAARSANEVRRLFIYDDYNQKLISIVNSEDYPNMLYNKELNCIDAFIVTGGTSTHFARIKKDSLIEFASVHNDNNRTVYEIDKYGKEKIIHKYANINNERVYARYKNYKPLKEY